ncbi:hypothetical protein FB005_113170 [Sinorhizobium medicae]|uniref:Uncharacterized protein n=1 Tax=Sinorhizobium medicae TaxID=110321 RepID=A0A508WUZ6_9HYPH|nr:hypothetical protein FB006_11339 [Sinorhizobium medicae]TWA40980.1 hypothetical protein FB005_113170 [Sinorhizobium medicae]VTZ61045.1 hypothetical protein EMEDMD4_230046 [Sinorhizobium medicae]
MTACEVKLFSQLDGCSMEPKGGCAVIAASFRFGYVHFRPTCLIKEPH